MGDSASNDSAQLAYLNGKVYAVYHGDGDDPSMWMNVWDGSSWGDDFQLGFAGATTTIVAFNNTLYIFSIGNQNHVFYNKYDPTERRLAPTVVLPIVSAVAPALAADDSLGELLIVGHAPTNGQLFEVTMYRNETLGTPTPLSGALEPNTNGPSITRHTGQDGSTRFYLAYTSNAVGSVGATMLGSRLTGQMGVDWGFHQVTQAGTGYPGPSPYPPAIASFHGVLHLVHTIEYNDPGHIGWLYSLDDGASWSAQQFLPGSSGPETMFGAPSFAVRPAQEGLPDQLILAHPAGYDEQTSIFGDHDLWYTVFE